MKKLLLLLLLFISFNINAKSKKEIAIINAKIDSIYNATKPFFQITDEGIVFSRVIEAPGINKEELFNKCLDILNKAYIDSKEVIQSKDKESGIINGKGLFLYKIWSNWAGVVGRKEASHIINIKIKDNRFKVSILISNIKHFNGYGALLTTHNVKDFYPFWTNCPDKNKENSFYSIYFTFTNSLSILDKFQNEIKKTNTSDDDW